MKNSHPPSLAGSVLPRNGDAAALIGKSPLIENVRRFVEIAAPYTIPVLITGETGTGKGVVAKLIHEKSGRKGQFVSINCSASIPEELLMSDLFGHAKGAFTGAHANRKGNIHTAEGGTVFLDEIGGMPIHMQRTLLNAIETNEVRPVGSDAASHIDARFICATNADLQKLIKEGRFRDDFYYRLNTLEISLPSLRSRPDDVYLLIAHFISEFNSQYEKKATIDGDAMRSMCEIVDSIKGNIRGLRSIVQRAAIFSVENNYVITQDNPVFAGTFIDYDLLPSPRIDRDGESVRIIPAMAGPILSRSILKAHLLSHSLFMVHIGKDRIKSKVAALLGIEHRMLHLNQNEVLDTVMEIRKEVLFGMAITKGMNNVAIGRELGMARTNVTKLLKDAGITRELMVTSASQAG